VNHVDNGLGWILSRFFVEKAFSEKAKSFGDQIVSDIKEMFIEKLKKTTWMDKSVIQLAIDKVHKIVQKIGYPTEVCWEESLAGLKLTFYRAPTLWIHQVYTSIINL
jgi:predicted metalloendopeptidase